jgi:hypothetical protein
VSFHKFSTVLLFLNDGALLTSPFCIASVTHPTLRTAVGQIRVLTVDAFRTLPNTHLFLKGEAPNPLSQISPNRNIASV